VRYGFEITRSKRYHVRQIVTSSRPDLVGEAGNHGARRLWEETQAVEVDDDFLTPQWLQALSCLGEEPVGGKAVEAGQLPEPTKGDASFAPFVAPYNGSFESRRGALLDVSEREPSGSPGTPQDLADGLVEPFQLGHPPHRNPGQKSENVSRDYEGCTHNWISTSR
jgi:hypothetical protein